MREISSQGRDATGVRVMNLDDGQTVASVAPILAANDDDGLSRPQLIAGRRARPLIPPARRWPWQSHAVVGDVAVGGWTVPIVAPR